MSVFTLARHRRQPDGIATLQLSAGAVAELAALSLEETDALMWMLAQKFRGEDGPPSYARYCYEQGQGMVVEAAKYASTRAKWLRGWAL